MKLSWEQVDAIEKISDFIDSDIKIFFLKGKAGTGKTTLIKNIINKFDTKFDKIELMASTGRASKILRNKIQYGVNTIHKSIFKESKISIQNTGVFQSQFRLENIKENESILYIIDESSLIGNTAPSKDELAERHLKFSDEKLLKNFLSFACSDENKIIFVGDPCQLSAINEKNELTPALSKEYFASKFNLESNEFTLTEVIRQKPNSVILKNAEIVRNLIEQNKISPQISFREKFDEFEYIYEQEYLDLYEENIEDSIVISRSNRRTLTLSKQLRELLGFKGILDKGDKLLVVKNCYHKDIMNGEFVSISSLLKMNSSSEEVIIGGKTVNLVLHTVEISLDNQIIEIDVLSNYLLDYDYPENSNYIESAITKVSALSNSAKSVKSFLIKLLDKKYKFLDLEVRANLIKEYEDMSHKDFDIVMFTKNLRSKFSNVAIIRIIDGEFFLKEVYEFYEENCINKTDRENPFYRALAVRYGYAITCHKAQGGEYSNVFIEKKDIENTSDLKWIYTAITRAKERVFIVKNPSLIKELKSYYDIGYVIKDIEIKRIINIKGDTEKEGEDYPCLKLSSDAPKAKNEATNKWLKGLYKNLKSTNLDNFEELAEIFGIFHITKVLKEKEFFNDIHVTTFETSSSSFSGYVSREEISFYFGLSSSFYEVSLENAEEHYKDEVFGRALYLKGNFINDLFSGKKYEYYSTGELRAEYSYRNGKLNGEFIEYYKKGNIRKSLTFIHGQLIHPFKYFLKTGHEFERVYVSYDYELITHSLKKDNIDLPIVFDFLSIIQKNKNYIEENLIGFDIDAYIRNQQKREFLENNNIYLDPCEYEEQYYKDTSSEYEMDTEIDNYLLDSFDLLVDNLIIFFNEYGFERKYRLLNIEEKYFIEIVNMLTREIEKLHLKKLRTVRTLDISVIKSAGYFYEFKTKEYLGAISKTPIEEIMNEDIMLKSKLNTKKKERKRKLVLTPEDLKMLDFSLDEDSSSVLICE